MLNPPGEPFTLLLNRCLIGTLITQDGDYVYIDYPDPTRVCVVSSRCPEGTSLVTSESHSSMVLEGLLTLE